MLTKEVPPYPDPRKRPPPRLPDLQEDERTLTDSDIDIKTVFEENSPYQEGIISESYQRPDKSYVQEPPELGDLLDTGELIETFLPKQMDIDRILEIILRKVLKGTHTPITMKEILSGYLTSPYFKDLYLYLAQNKLPSKKSAIHKVEAPAEKFILLDSLLFKLITMPDKEIVILAIPEICMDKIITLYHSSLFAGHQGIIKHILLLGTSYLYQALCITYIHLLRVATYVNWQGKINLQKDSYRLEFT